MRLNHPTDVGRSKDVPDDLVEKFLAGGWTKAEGPKTPAKKSTARKPSSD